MIFLVFFLALLGFAICIYGFALEKKVTQNSAYKAACDLSDRVSCSKPILSGYSKTFGISNTLWGMGYYLVMMVISLMRLDLLVFWLSGAAILGSIYLAFILFTKVRSFCLLCVSIYCVNIAIFVASYYAVYQG